MKNAIRPHNPAPVIAPYNPSPDQIRADWEGRAAKAPATGNRALRAAIFGKKG